MENETATPSICENPHPAANEISTATATPHLKVVEITHFPVELLLLCFSHFNLKCLIAAYGVCRRWRELIPFANLRAPRKALFQLYLEVVSSPFFPETRPWILQKVKDFDREAFLAAMLEQHDYIPEHFRVWILEWPTRAVYGCIWPGLPLYLRTGGADDLLMTKGANWLAERPQIYSIQWPRTDQNKDFVPGIVVGVADVSCTWLPLDEREEFRNKVFDIYNIGRFRAGHSDAYIVHENWVQFLRNGWKQLEDRAKQRVNIVDLFPPPNLPAFSARLVGYCLESE